MPEATTLVGRQHGQAPGLDRMRRACPAGRSDCCERESDLGPHPGADLGDGRCELRNAAGAQEEVGAVPQAANGAVVGKRADAAMTQFDAKINESPSSTTTFPSSTGSRRSRAFLVTGI
jgi:hypothetical protein